MEDAKAVLKGDRPLSDLTLKERELVANRYRYAMDELPRTYANDPMRLDAATRYNEARIRFLEGRQATPPGKVTDYYPGAQFGPPE